jgi:hypothetical protein
MKKLSTIAIGAFMGASVLALSAASASAAVVCNEDGECWHVGVRHEYPPSAGVVIMTTIGALANATVGGSMRGAGTGAGATG